MTEQRPGGQPRPFTPAELDGASGAHPDELAADTRIARDLESLAARTAPTRSADFADRVMTAIAAEPAPAPARLAGRALRRGSLGAFVASLRDAWRVTVGTGFPVAARAQAMALVLVVAALATGSGMVTAGALGLFDSSPSTPAPTIEQPSEEVSSSSEASETPEPTEEASQSPDASESPDPSRSPETESAAPAPTARPGDSVDEHASSGTGSSATSRPTSTPTPTSTPSGEDHHSPRPSDGPWPSETPNPTSTPSGD